MHFLIVPFLIVPFVLGLALYFLPTMIGFRKRNAGAIFALNLFLGWTLVGWVVALVWSLTVEDAQDTMLVQPMIVQAPPAWTCAICRVPVARSDSFCRSCGTKIGWPS